MDRGQISHIAQRDHPVAAPVSGGRVQGIVDTLTPLDAGRILDLGCGSGVWLLKTLATHPGVFGVGVDISRSGLEDAQREAAERGLSDRSRWVEADASAWSNDAFGVGVCIGASHVFGGLDGTLSAALAHLRSGGEVVRRDTIWERPSTPAALKALQAAGDDFPDLVGLVARVRAHGFEIGDGHVSTLEEWGRLRVVVDRLVRVLGSRPTSRRRGTDGSARRRPRTPRHLAPGLQAAIRLRHPRPPRRGDTRRVR